MTCGLDKKYRDEKCENCDIKNMTPAQCVKCQGKHKNS